jgi:hypothetical protein
MKKSKSRAVPSVCTTLLLIAASRLAVTATLAWK